MSSHFVIFPLEAASYIPWAMLRSALERSVGPSEYIGCKIDPQSWIDLKIERKAGSFRTEIVVPLKGIQWQVISFTSERN